MLAKDGSHQRDLATVLAIPISVLDPVISPWASHPTLTALRDSLQITADCWALLATQDGSSRKEQHLPKGERELDTAYCKRLDAARPSGFFRDALRTYAGMLSRGSWVNLPPSLGSALAAVDGRCMALGVLLAATLQLPGRACDARSARWVARLSAGR